MPEPIATHFANDVLGDMVLRRALDASPNAVLVTDPDGVILYANRAYTKFTGFSAAESIGKTPRTLKSGRTPEATYREMWTTIRSGRTWHGRILNRRKKQASWRIHGPPDESSAELYWASLSIAPILGHQGECLGYIGTHQDISERVRSEERRCFERNEARLRAEIGIALQAQTPLRERLFEALRILLRLEELQIQQRGGVFWRPNDRAQLELLVTCGEFGDELLRWDRQVPFGDCLCGKAAAGGELLVSDDCFCDPRHERTNAGMVSHGHYIVPLRAAGRVLGVMFLYTAPYPTRDENRLDMLRAVGDMMGLAIANELLHQRLIAARDEARSASAAKGSFLANMSHEIRTPLTAILGFSESLMDGESSLASVADAAGTIHRNGEHLLELINDLLDLSKIEAGRLSTERIACRPRKLLADTIALLSPRAEAGGLSLEANYAANVPENIQTDPTRLRQILVNLIGNAIKFTTEGGVRVVVDTVGQGDVRVLTIDVVDSGIGLRTDQIARLFQPFAQGDESTTRRFGGTGLGLAISKRLATALGGDVELVESAPDQGSRFRVTLPIRAGEDDPAADDIVGEPVRSRAADRPHATQVPPDALRGCHVLVAEDCVDNQRLVRMVLERASAKVSVVGDGQQAVDTALAAHGGARPFDVILMDMQMPVLDGYDATRALRESGCATPIIALTAHAMVGDRNKCLAAGCDDYLAKPIDRIAMITLIGAHVARAELENATASQ